MKSRRVVILLLPGRIEIAAISGSAVTKAERIDAALSGDAADWADEVRALSSALKPVVDRLGLEGAPAAVLFASPTQSVEPMSLQAKSTGQAVQAAQLSSTDSLSYPAHEAVCEVMILGRDAPGEGRQTHLLACVERDASLQAIADFIEASSLRFESAAPLEGAVIAEIVGAALADPARDAAALVVGESSSLFLAMRSGRLRFVRRIGLGTDHLITSLTRPIRSAAGGEDIELDRALAARTLYLCGIPGKDRSGEWPEGVSPTQLMPLLQPVLQRLVVELRQSLRFSLSESERQGFALTSSGPGGGIGGLAELLQEELGLEVSVDPACRGFDGAAPAAKGSEFLAAIEHGQFIERVRLAPRAVSAKQAHRRYRRWLWAGAGAAVIAVGFDGFRAQARLEQAQRHAASLAMQTSESATLQTTFTRLAESLGAMNNLEQQLAREVGGRPNVRALMQELSRLVPPSIRLRSISLQRVAGATVASVQGYRVDGPGPGPALGLDELVVLLGASPLMDHVTLGHVQASDADGSPAQEFLVSFTAVAAPEEARTP